MREEPGAGSGMCFASRSIPGLGENFPSRFPHVLLLLLPPRGGGHVVAVVIFPSRCSPLFLWLGVPVLWQGQGWGGQEGGFLPDPSPCCFPSAGLFQHLIIYCRLCGQLYRGSYCLIELLDSSAAKIGTGTGKKGFPPSCRAARGTGTAQSPGKIRVFRGDLG